jgi:hypothetical protein
MGSCRWLPDWRQSRLPRASVPKPHGLLSPAGAGVGDIPMMTASSQRNVGARTKDLLAASEKEFTVDGIADPAGGSDATVAKGTNEDRGLLKTMRHGIDQPPPP